jgi:hypothetical protein
MSGRSTNYTADLRRYKREGARIVCKVAPYADQEVVYTPRKQGDPSPWVLRSEPNGFRYNGRECSAVTPHGGGPWVVARLLRLP